PSDDGESEPGVTNEPSPQGATELRIAVEPELHVPSDQVSEPATTPAMREKVVASEIAEGSSVHCNMPEGDLIDLYADLPPLLPPSSERSLTPVPTSSLAGAPISEFSPEKAPVPKLSPERAPVSKPSPEKDSVPKFSPERDSVPKGIPESPEAHKCLPSHPLL
ncbi:hypothetical protein M9458_026729, partial [Cirrhinus mrigala]